jgi:NADPH-dependent 2,4-dienoyl-CoA reductase/sulfur reductase-like enzyme
VIIATGCRARPWRGPGVELAGVHRLRGLDDALALRDTLRPGARLLIVGAGFIGCEVAASARARGVTVTLVDIAPFPMLPLGPELGERCAAMHRDRGVDVRLGTGVRELAGRGGRVARAVLSDGSELEVDAVLLALGAVPNTEWLHGSGLTVEPGVVCDATLTSVEDPDVLAAGDLAAWPHPLGGSDPVRVEHWTTAAEHGGLAGRNALREPAERTAHTAPPYFWSDQYDTKIQAVGFPARAERLEIVETSEDGTRLLAVGAHDGRVVAAVAFNAAKRLAGLRRRLAREGAPAADDLLAELASDPARLGAAAGAAR